MSSLSRSLFALLVPLAFLYLVVMKGIPQPKPDLKQGDTFTDLLFQPALAALWGLLGYFVNALVFALVVVLIVKLARLAYEFAKDPRLPAEE